MVSRALLYSTKKNLSEGPSGSNRSIANYCSIDYNDLRLLNRVDHDQSIGPELAADLQ